MKDLLKKIFKPKYEPFNEIRISSLAILNNIDVLLEKQKGLEMFPVLKSNAYGHGIAEMCQILNKSKVKIVAVDSYPEAQIVYKYFKGEVLIIGEMPQKAYNYTKFNRSHFVVYKEETIKYLASLNKKIKVHLFVNSGMNREGINDINLFIKNNKKYLDKLNICGFCSHLGAADEYDSKLEFNNKQLNKFFDSLDVVRSFGFKPKYIHMNNSSGSLKIVDSRFTAFRPGLSVYGYNPFEDDKITLKPALELYSTLNHVFSIKAGESVSYNNNFIANKDTHIGLIPFGYFEGLDRSLSNKAELKVLNNNIFYAKIAGSVCMNLSCLNLGKNNISNNTKVQIISKNKEDKNSLYNLKKISNLSYYEILVRLQANIRRKIVD